MTISIGIFGCNQTPETEEEYLPPLPSWPPTTSNCIVNSFMEGISMYSNYSNVYIIKGIVLDKIEYGLNIKLVEDLKGNFPINVNAFTVWGNGEPRNVTNGRQDNLTFLYKKQDVLIMHLTPARDLSFILPPEFTWLEKPEDYTTFDCTWSVLKLSEDYVIGVILPYDEKKDRWWENMTEEELHSYIESLPLEEQKTIFMDTMPYNDFQKEINKLLNR